MRIWPTRSDGDGGVYQTGTWLSSVHFSEAANYADINEV